MNTKLYLGNLPFSIDEDYLADLFSRSGSVKNVNIPTDRETGRKRGFAFIEMASQEEAEAAITALNGHTIEGRQIVVNQARPSEKGRDRRY